MRLGRVPIEFVKICGRARALLKVLPQALARTSSSSAMEGKHVLFVVDHARLKLLSTDVGGDGGVDAR